jgi:hypothetical protein
MGWRDRVKPRNITHNNNSITSDPVSLEELEKIAGEIKSKVLPLPSPEILIMTDKHFEILHKEFPPPNDRVSFLPGDSLGIGIPIETYPTYEECRSRAFILLDEGKRVGLIEDAPEGN